MPTNLPAPDPFRPRPFQEARQDRLTIAAILFACGLLTLGLALRPPEDAQFVTQAF